MKKAKFIIFFCILSLIALIITGCGGECKENSECNDNNACTRDICSDKECKHIKITGCFEGDGKCDESKGENRCNSKDCKPACKGKVDNYLSWQCDEDDNCITDLTKAPEVESKTDTITVEERRQTVLKLLTTYTYNNPIDIGGETININIKIDSIDKIISEVKITRIQIIEHLGQKTRRGYNSDDIKVYANEEINRILYDTKSEINKDIRLDLTLNESKEKTLSVKISYTYKKEDLRGDLTDENGEHEYDLSKLVLTNPTKKRSCPKTCNDNNPCTLEKCSSRTNFFCEHDAINNCNGNLICETGENKCTAPTDCGVCARDVGEYTTYACVNDKCVPALKKAAESRKITKDRSIPSTTNEDVKLKFTVSYKEPFSLGTDKLSIDVNALSMKDTTTNFKITIIELIDRSEQLGIASSVDQFFSAGDQKVIELTPEFSPSEVETKKDTSLKIYYSYNGVDSRGDPQTYTNQVYEMPIGNINFINTAIEG